MIIGLLLCFSCLSSIQLFYSHWETLHWTFYAGGPSLVHVTLRHYVRAGGFFNVWHVLLNNDTKRRTQWSYEILDRNFNRSVFGHCGEIHNNIQQKSTHCDENILITNNPERNKRDFIAFCLLPLVLFDRTTLRCKVNGLLTWRKVLRLIPGVR